jgi:iron complex transport system substrate-binding protein
MSSRLRTIVRASVLVAVLAGFLAGPAAAAEPRIVSLAPHLTELAYSAGLESRLVGVVEWSDFPEAANALPRIGDAFRFDPERILELGTTHALVWVGGTPAAAIEQIEALGVEVVPIETRSLEQIGQALDALSTLADDPGVGRSAAAAFRKRLDRLQGERSDEPPIRVFYQISPRPLFTLGQRHVINEVFDLCGAVNVFTDLDQEAASVSAEAVLDRNPDLILVGLEPLDGPDQDGNEDTKARAFDRLNAQLKRFECSAVMGVEAEPLVRPTARILDAAAALCARLGRVQLDDADRCDR